MHEMEINAYDIYSKYALLFSKTDIDGQLLKIILKHKKILEIGCGTGEIALEVAKQGVRVFCVDASSRMLEILKNRMIQKELSVTVINSTADSFDLKESFSLIYGHWVFGHFYDADLLFNSVENLTRHLEHGGVLLFNLANPKLIKQNIEKKLLQTVEVNETNSIYKMFVIHQPALNCSDYFFFYLCF